MELECRMASIDGFTQEILKKDDVRAQTQNQYNLDNNYGYSNVFSNARKIFVGGLPSDLTTEEFKVFFEQFGSIEDVVVMTNKETNRPRGFGFVTFESQETTNNVIKGRFYELKNKRIEVKKAVSKDRMGGSLGNYYHNFANFNGYFYGMNVSRYGGYSYLGYDGLSYAYYPYQNPIPSCYTNTWPFQYLYDHAARNSYPSPYVNGNIPYISIKSKKYRNRPPVVIKKSSNVKKYDDSSVAEKEKGEKGCDHSRQRDSNDKESVVNGVLEKGCDHLKQRDSNDEVSVVKGVLENCDGLSLHSEGSSRQSVMKGVLEKGCDKLRQGDSNDEEIVVECKLKHCDGDHGEICDGLSLHSDGSSKQMEQIDDLHVQLICDMSAKFYARLKQFDSSHL